MPWLPTWSVPYVVWTSFPSFLNAAGLAIQRGWTPLHVACENGHVEGIVALLKADADANAADNVSDMVN